MRRVRSRHRIKKALLGASPFVFLIFVWHLVSTNGLVEPYFLPEPSQVLQAFYDQITQGTLWPDLKASFYRVTVGYLLAVLAGVPVGIALGGYKPFRSFFEPFNNFVRYTPLPAFIPLIVLWVGIGDANPITVIFLGVFWSLVVLVGDSVSNIPIQHIELARTMGFSRISCLFHVVLPHSLPGIYDALRVGAGWAWSSLVLAEIVGANTGIGHMLMESQRFLKTANVIGGIILVGLLGLLIDYLFSWGYSPLFPWTERARQESKDALSMAKDETI